MLVKEILLKLCKYTQDATNKQSSLSGLYAKKSHPVIVKLIDYIENNLEKSLSLDILASKMFASKYYLSHLFKQETNTSLHQYIIKKRLVFLSS